MKRVISCILLLLFSLSICACSSKSDVFQIGGEQRTSSGALTEEEIISSLPAELITREISTPVGTEYADLSVDSFHIDKRLTNERDDTVWCSVVFSNSEYVFDESIVLYYFYYDVGGWMLENFERDRNDYTVLSNPFSDEEIADYIEYTYGPGEVSLEYFDQKETVIYSFSSADVHTNATVYTNGEVTLEFNGYSWKDNVSATIEEDWNIEGHWVFTSEGLEKVRKDYDTFYVEFEIEAFDPESEVVLGYCDYDGYEMFYFDEEEYEADITVISGKIIQDSRGSEPTITKGKVIIDEHFWHYYKLVINYDDAFVTCDRLWDPNIYDVPMERV